MSDDELNQTYRRRRDDDPAITIYWIASAIDKRPVKLNAWSCWWCKTTIMDQIAGTIDSIVNAPVSLDDFGISGTIRCRLCRQNYRLVIRDSYIPLK